MYLRCDIGRFCTINEYKERRKKHIEIEQHNEKHIWEYASGPIIKELINKTPDCNFRTLNVVSGE